MHVFEIIFKNLRVVKFCANLNEVKKMRKGNCSYVCFVFQIMCLKEDKRKTKIALIIARHVLNLCVY